MLRAFEAQLFICASKNTCRLLTTSLTCGTSRDDFLLEDYVIGSEYLARARTIARRAGIVWAVADQPCAPPGTREYNAYVRRVDSMIVEVNPSRASPLNHSSTARIGSLTVSRRRMTAQEHGSTTSSRTSRMTAHCETRSSTSSSRSAVLVASTSWNTWLACGRIPSALERQGQEAYHESVSPRRFRQAVARSPLAHARRMLCPQYLRCGHSDRLTGESSMTAVFSKCSGQDFGEQRRGGTR